MRDVHHGGSLRFRQRGIATILTVLLVGVSLTVAVLGVMYYIRSAQNQLLSVHAQTQAQMRAWTGAEVVRQFIERINKKEKLKELAQAITNAPEGKLALKINGLNGVSAVLTAVDKTTEPRQFTAELTGLAAKDSAAESKALLRVVYVFGENKSITLPPGNNINRNFHTSGGTEIQTEDSSSVVITVNGDYTTGGNSTKGLSIHSTGSISIGSSSTFDELKANCDVALTGAVNSGDIQARRNICLSGGAYASGTATANGTISAQGGYDLNGTLNAIGHATPGESCRASGSSADSNSLLAGTCAALDNGLLVDLGFGSAGAKNVNAKGDVSIASGTIGRLAAEGNLILKNWWATVAGEIGGNVIKNGNNAHLESLITKPGLIVPIEPVSKVTAEFYVVNAYDYKADANYVFLVENGYKKVTIKDVAGIADGTYFLATAYNDDKNYPDYLCKVLTADSTASSPKCDMEKTPFNTLKTICRGTSPQNGCFGYDDANKKWTFEGASDGTAGLAPGVVWVEGDLAIKYGTFYNTFVVTKNFYTTGDTKVYAPGYAGYSGTVGGKQYAPTGICENVNFPGIYPKQFCDTANGLYLADGAGLGNYAVIAGSVPPGTAYSEETYVGGNIEMNAKTELFGDILAGNQIGGSGDTTIHGYASAQGMGSSTKNVLTGKTTFVVKNLPETFHRGPSLQVQLPPGESSSTPNTLKVKWATYL